MLRTGVAALVLLVAAGCGSRPQNGLPDAGDVRDAGPGADAAWGGLTVDEPFTTDQIELVSTQSAEGFTAEFYRNKAYTCGKRSADGSEGYQTFVIAYRQGLGREETRPLWGRLHGGGVGAYRPDGTYTPEYFSSLLDEESFAELAGLMRETGLMAKVRAHPAGFRFLMPSLCDHDVYSGVGVPEPNNPNSPDAAGRTRAADGLLATKAALAFTRARFATSHVFLHGTSAGSIGSFSVAYTLERSGSRLSGVVMDSHVSSAAFRDVIDTGCTDYTWDLIAAKVGPLTEPEHLQDLVVMRGAISTPIMHVWSYRDFSCCGDTQHTFTVPDGSGGEQTLGACDYHHEALRAAIEASPPAGVSENLRMCVNDPDRTDGQCTYHSPTKIAFDSVSPPGDQLHGGRDYNQHIIDWVSQRLQEPAP